MEELKNKSESIERFVDLNEPSSEIRIVVNRCSFSEGEIEYVSLLQINKIVKYFYLQDEFSIDSPDPDGMDSYLAGFRNEPYSKKQFDIDEMICNYPTVIWLVSSLSLNFFIPGYTSSISLIYNLE